MELNKNEVNPICLLCKQDNETLHHFLIICATLEDSRKSVMVDIYNAVSDLLVTWSLTSKYSLVQLIVDIKSLKVILLLPCCLEIFKHAP